MGLTVNQWLAEFDSLMRSKWHSLGVLNGSTRVSRFESGHVHQLWRVPIAGLRPHKPRWNEERYLGPQPV